MGSLTVAERNKVLDHITGRSGYTAPTDAYLQPTTTVPTASSAGTAISGGGFARIAVTFSAASAGAITNSADVEFGAAGADYGDIAGWDLYDAVTGGDRIAWDSQSPVKAYNTSDTLTVPAGDLDITMAAA